MLAATQYAETKEKFAEQRGYERGLQEGLKGSGGEKVEG